MTVGLSQKFKSPGWMHPSEMWTSPPNLPTTEFDRNVLHPVLSPDSDPIIYAIPLRGSYVYPIFDESL